MTKQQLTWNIEPTVEIKIQPARKTSSFLQLTGVRASHRKIRIALPTLPRRQCCITRRAMLAALREAELEEWQATGGDVLSSSMHQPVC
jgi:hypothetical protein